jgi:hypothetical protein
VFPSIIQVVLTYANTNHTDFDKIVLDINQKLLEFVLRTMQNKKGHFESIFKELKDQFKIGRTVGIYLLIV